MRRSRARALIALTLALGWLWLLAPGVVGGVTTYVTTHGVSMEPGFRAGDLAILRPANEYRVGDVAGYRSAMLDTLVMHRIVEVRPGPRYVFQGDNNSWLDPETPGDDEIVGRLVLRIPGGGVWLARVSSPPVMSAALALLLLAGTTTTVAAGVRRRRRRPAAKPTPLLRPIPAAPTWTSVEAAVAMAVAGLLAAAGACAGLLAWAGPAVTPPPPAPPEPRAVTFSYRAEVPAGPVYDGRVVTSPDPVFRSLTDTVDVHLRYRGPAATVRVEARLTTMGGWRSTVPLLTQRPVTRGSDLRLPLDLRALEGRAAAAAEVTGIPVQQLVVAVVPIVEAPGRAAFTPSFGLSLSSLMLGPAPGLTDYTATEPVAAQRKSGPRSVMVLGRSLPVRVVRAVAWGLVPVALVGGMAAIGLAYRRRGLDEAALIRRRHSEQLVAVQPIPLAGATVVASFAELRRLAERYGLLVLHWSDRAGATFVVQDGETTYCYRSAAPPPNTPPPNTPPPATAAEPAIPRQRGPARHVARAD